MQGRAVRTIVAGRTVYEYRVIGSRLGRSVPCLSLQFGAFAFGYLLGSIPFGLIFTRFAGTQDIRTHRLRQHRRDQRAAHRPQGARRGDAARRHAQGHRRGLLIAAGGAAATSRLVAGLGALLGHVFPVWLEFKGGKGVATYIGVLIALSWPVALAFGVIWLAVAAASPATRRSRRWSPAPRRRCCCGSRRRPGGAAVCRAHRAGWIMHRANIARLHRRHRKQDRPASGPDLPRARRLRDQSAARRTPVM